MKWLLCVITSDQLKSPPSLGLRVQILNFIMNQFPKQRRWKEYPHEQNSKATNVWKNVRETRLDGEFWAGYVISHKIYSLRYEKYWCISLTLLFVSIQEKDFDQLAGQYAVSVQSWRILCGKGSCKRHICKLIELKELELKYQLYYLWTLCNLFQSSLI